MCQQAVVSVYEYVFVCGICKHVCPYVGPPMPCSGKVREEAALWVSPYLSICDQEVPLEMDALP